MNILNVEGLAKQFSERLLFADVTFGLDSRDRVGLIGVNGSGKSTLLRIIAGVEEPDQGRMTFMGATRVGFLPQNPLLDDSKTVLEQVFAGDSESTRLLRDYEHLSARLEHTPDDAQLQAQVADLMPQLDTLGAWEAEANAKTILSQLGIGDLLDTRVGALSGGQRKRVAMAAALIDRPDLLILDEPTNHIDTDTVAWLESELARWPGALLLITHDRYFLDRVVTRMIEIDNGQVFFYSGNYERFLEAKAAREARSEAEELARQNLLRRELAWLRRGARARSTKQKAHVERVHTLMNQEGPAQRQDLDIAVAASRRLGSKVLRLDKLAKRFEQRAVVTNFSYIVEPGDRIGVIGPNGSGKSTLLNLIAGRSLPDSGTIELGETVYLGYYDQESSELNPNQRVIDYIKESAEIVHTADGSTVTASQMLERFLFPGSAQYTLIGRLSGGERRRLYLLRTLMAAPNLLLLDEPTNDLDITTLSILEDYLDDFPGTLIVVSHDRYFLDRTVERLLVFEGEGRIVEYPGGYSDYRALRPEPKDSKAPSAERRAQNADNRQRMADGGQATPTAQPGSAGTPASANPTKPRKLTTKEQRELAALEQQIAQLEAQKALLYAQLGQGGSYQQIEQLSTELASLEATIEQAMERWIELSERAG